MSTDALSDVVSYPNSRDPNTIEPRCAVAQADTHPEPNMQLLNCFPGTSGILEECYARVYFFAIDKADKEVKLAIVRTGR